MSEHAVLTMFEMGLRPGESLGDRLEWRAEDWRRAFPEQVEVLRRLAEDPTTPVEHLAQMLDIVPLEVLRNPALPGSDFMSHLRPISLPEDTPLRTRDLGKVISGSDRPWLRRLLGEGSSPAEMFELIAREPKLAFRIGQLLGEWAADRATSGDDLALLAQSPDYLIRHAVARHRNLLPQTAAQLLVDAHVSVRLQAASHRAAPKELKKLLARAEKSTITIEERDQLLAGGPYARQLAINHLEEPEVIRLYETGDDATRRAIAEGRFCDVLAARLARDPDPEVRKSAASSSQLPLEDLERLASDPDLWVRYGVVLNRSTPEPLLRRLCEDSERRVRERAAKRLQGE